MYEIKLHGMEFSICGIMLSAWNISNLGAFGLDFFGLEMFNL